MATSPNTVTPPTPAARSPKLLIAGLISLSLCALAVAAYAVTRTQGGEPQTKPPRQVVEKPIFVALEPITVNLQQGEGRGRFLHVGMALKVSDEKAKAQVVEFMPELRSRALMMLSNRAAETLQTTEDKSRLAAEIQAELSRPLNDTLPPQGIVGVSFNAFVVQ